MEGIPKGNKEKLSRRDFLRNTAATTVAMGSIAYGLEDMPNPKKDIAPPPDRKLNPRERHKSIKYMESPNATYAIEYASHNKASSPEVMANADALLLEYSDDLTTKDDVLSVLTALLEEGKDDTDERPYILLMKEAVKSNKPIFFVDLLNRKAVPDLIHPISVKNVIGVSETAGGGVVAAQLIRAPGKEEANDTSKGTSRRSVLEKGLWGLASGWLLSPGIENGLKKASLSDGTSDESGMARGLEKEVGALNETIHPELRTMTTQTRSELMAQKSETVAKLLTAELGRRPTLALEIGGDHFGIERALMRSEEERIATLKKDMGEGLKHQEGIVRAQFIGSGDSVRADVKLLVDSAIAAS